MKKPQREPEPKVVRGVPITQTARVAVYGTVTLQPIPDELKRLLPWLLNDDKRGGKTP